MSRLCRRIGALVATVGLLLPIAAQGASAASKPAIAWSPTTGTGTYGYGVIEVGQTASQTFTLTNSGGSATSALRVALSGFVAFTKTADTCIGTSLGPGKSCLVSIQYTPAAEGQTDSATLTASAQKPAAKASLTLTGSGAVPRHVYWSNYAGESIGRADVNGQNSNQSFISVADGLPSALAVDANHIYWSNEANGTIGRADLNGQNENQSFISVSLGFTRGVAVDANHIYWANEGTIGRADLDGQNVDESFITGIHAEFVAVDSNHIYWNENENSATIGRADLNGQNVNDSFISLAGFARGVAVDANHIYWATSNGIGRAELDGQNVNESFITGASNPLGVAVDSSSIYWANQGNSLGTTVGRADLNGQNVNETFITGTPAPFGVAVDAG